MRFSRNLLPPLTALLCALALAACHGGNGGSSPTTSPRSATPSVSPSPAETAAPSPGVSVTPTPAPAVHAGPAEQPLGFPIDPATRLGVVTGDAGSRRLVFGGGPAAEAYARDGQPSDDPVQANRSGWNCRTHREYEGIAAVDFYIPTKTRILSTMSGEATLYAVSTTNDFDYYGVSREPYLGDPDRSRAPYSPFPGSSGGKGVYVRVENGQFATEYAHLDLAPTAGVVPRDAFLGEYGPGSDYNALFAFTGVRRAPEPIARWSVQRGGVIGLSGDAGYSEGPHLHYTVQRLGGPLLCPTSEAGFSDGGWLFR